MKKNAKNEKATKATKKKVLVILAEVPAAAEKALKRPDRYGKKGALEYRLDEWTGADVEAEVAGAMDEGMDVGMTPAEARKAVELRWAGFVSKTRADAIEEFIIGTRKEGGAE